MRPAGQASRPITMIYVLGSHSLADLVMQGSGKWRRKSDLFELPLSGAEAKFKRRGADHEDLWQFKRYASERIYCRMHHDQLAEGLDMTASKCVKASVQYPLVAGASLFLG